MPGASSTNPSATVNLAPILAASTSAGTAPKIKPAMSGNNLHPESCASTPRTAWKYCGRVNKAPNAATALAAIRVTPHVNRGVRSKSMLIDRLPPRASAERALPEPKGDEYPDAGDHGNQRPRAGPPIAAGFDHSIDRYRQAASEQHGPDEVDLRPLRRSRFRHQREDGEQAQRRYRDVHQKHPAPPVVGQEPAPKHGTERQMRWLRPIPRWCSPCWGAGELLAGAPPS